MITSKKKKKNTKEKVHVGVFRWKRFDSIYMLRRKSIEREREKILMDQGGRNSGSRWEEGKETGEHKVKVSLHIDRLGNLSSGVSL